MGLDTSKEAEEELAYKIAALDADGDGKINFEEFVKP